MQALDAQIGVCLNRLRSDEAETAWRWFLSSYSQLLYGIIRVFAKDADEAGECFLFVCEKLADKNYRRLQSFEPNGSARFSTWLRAVVRNLCMDWMRSRFGRKQIFRSVASLSEVEQDIFRCVFHRGLSLEQTWIELRTHKTEISFDAFEQCASRVQSVLTSRQLWLLSTANATFVSLDAEADYQRPIEVRDPSLGPEELMILHDTHAAILNALRALEEGDRLLLRLRFFQGLSLAQVANLVGLKDPQTADRHIRDALEKLRGRLGISITKSGKRKSISV